MAVGCVTHVLHSPSKRKLNLIPLAGMCMCACVHVYMFLLARTMRGRLTAQVWVASSEGPASFIEIIDVLAKVNNNNNNNNNYYYYYYYRK